MSPIQAKDLTTKAMLVALNVTKWTARKYDKKANSAVETEFAAESKAGRYRKSLAAKEALAEVNSVVSAARDFHKENTRPWSDDGPRILPSKNYLFYTAEMRKYSAKYETAVNNLVENYGVLKDEAKQFLGGLYNEEDYPAVEMIRSKYTFKVVVMPIPSANDFRVTQITDEDINSIQQQITDRLEEANKVLMHDLWDRLYSVVEKACEAFKDPNARFHDSKLDNIQETVDILRRLNMDDDPSLERMCKLAEEKIVALNPEDIRKSPAVRQEAATDARKLLEAMSGYC